MTHPTPRALLRLLTVVVLSSLTTSVAWAAQPSNQWAVIVSTSRYFFNYRHTASALTMYHTLRQNGIDDDHILLFLADSYACDPRNRFAGKIYNSLLVNSQRSNLYGCNIQVDYAGDDVDVRRFMQVLQGRYDDNTPPTRRLRTDSNSNIIIYVAGHSAKSYIKFQDSEFLSSTDFAETFAMMHEQRRYGKILFLADTCHAIALCEKITAPNVVCLASSDAESDSYSHHSDSQLGLQVISRWTFEMQTILEGTNCSDPTAGQYNYLANSTSALWQSLYEFNYSPARKAAGSALAMPAHRDAVNAPGAVHQWRVSEFFCADPVPTTRVTLQTDLL